MLDLILVLIGIGLIGVLILEVYLSLRLLEKLGSILRNPILSIVIASLMAIVVIIATCFGVSYLINLLP